MAKQLIERELKFNDKYVYLSITRGSVESAQFTCCDNCGKLITNMVTVARLSDNKKLTIGTDCAETLNKAKCLYNNGTATDYQMDIYSYNKCARLVTELNKGAELVKDFIYAYALNAKGNRVEASIMDMQKYFPNYL